MSTRANLPLTDALPYYDTDIDTIAGMREAVQREIESEKAAMRSSHEAYAPPLHALFVQQPALAAELERAERGEKLQAIDTERYKLPAPAPDAPEEAWLDALRNAEVQLAHMDVRQRNLELLRRYGRTYILLTTANLWRLHNYQQEAMLGWITDAQETAKEETDDLNRARKDTHLRLGDKISTYESRWRDLVSKSLSITVANLTARAEIADYHTKIADLRRQLARMDQTGV
ncbi:unnamed protein product [Malassezia sympodialis ATCC 42132]|uniref:uncharacterized protein n=1 Tax=Malassezia sympodialis (strain ATCC 42132) TaxID=1230383 RepID=UPI0002C207C8|nr:uncharacterized protein MSY001_2830 [Malassezia sympodialis ATCC 42132]CCV00125.1 unnamed protein product [Malassezia sympodialis ATCC 42132]|eukprot:XP_018741334.1 uncharacterized protein MSY001_2830 [Malassezia sympodialis ATCC 42132]